jgi:hypothetical protein
LRRQISDWLVRPIVVQSADANLQSSLNNLQSRDC